LSGAGYPEIHQALVEAQQERLVQRSRANEAKAGAAVPANLLPHIQTAARLRPVSYLAIAVLTAPRDDN
jgi:hypothetical protein